MSYIPEVCVPVEGFPIKEFLIKMYVLCFRIVYSLQESKNSKNKFPSKKLSTKKLLFNNLSLN